MGTKLYVGNLNYNTTEESLRTAFSANGREVTSVSIIMDRETGRSRGFAFVELSTPEGAQQAMQELEGQDLDGRMLRINEARERDARGPRPSGYSSGPSGGGGGGGYAGRPPGVGPGPSSAGPGGPGGPPGGGPGGFRSGPPNSGGYRPAGGGAPGGYRSGPPGGGGDGRRKRSDKEKERGREGVAADRKKPRRANDDGDGW